MANENEVDNRPYAPPAASQAVLTTVALGKIATLIVANVTSALSSFAITTLDGSAIDMGALPVGVHQFNVQAVKVTWTGGAATVVAFQRI